MERKSSSEGTHNLDATESVTIQNMRGRPPSDEAMKTHFLEVVQGGQVRTLKESIRARITHSLEIAGGTGKDTERLPSQGGGSLSGDHRGREKLGHRKKVTAGGALASFRS